DESCLTKEELDHIEYIKRLAEQSSFEKALREKDASREVDKLKTEYELTQEEIDHIESVKRMAEWEVNEPLIREQVTAQTIERDSFSVEKVDSFAGREQEELDGQA
ncbi:hypothetical protein Tcan_00862, partial [Toxocara canis]